MKKLLVLLLILSLTTLCACKNSVVDDLPDDVIDSPDASQNEQTGSSDDQIDWETPIDIDDSFEEETEGEIDTTEGDDTEPSTDDPTNKETEPTNPSTPTQPTPTQPAPTDPVETTRPGSSGPIELPMIPG